MRHPTTVTVTDLRTGMRTVIDAHAHLYRNGERVRQDVAWGMLKESVSMGMNIARGMGAIARLHEAARFRKARVVR